MNIQYITVLVILSITCTLVYGDLGVTYKFDNVGNQQCDDCSWFIRFSYTYKVFGRFYRYGYLATNGFLAFNGYYGWKNPRYVNSWFRGPTVIAPLWSDIYPMNQIDTSHIIYTETSDYNLRNDARQVIRDNFVGCGEFFEPRAMFIATWEEQSSYCDRVSPLWPYIVNRGRRDADDDDSQGQDTQGEDDQGENANPQDDPGEDVDGDDEPEGKSNKSPEKLERNTIQVALVTDNCDTYAIINIYKLEWKNPSCPTRYRMLFNDGAWYNGNFYSNPSPDYAGESNVGIPGRWVYKIDDAMIRGPGCDTLGTHGGTPSVG